LGDDLFDLALSIRRRAFAYFDSDARDKSSSLEQSPEETDLPDRGFFLLANFLAFLDSEPWEKPPTESDDPVLSILDNVLTWLGGVPVMLGTDPCDMSPMESLDLDLILEGVGLGDVDSSSFDRQRAFPVIPGIKNELWWCFSESLITASARELTSSVISAWLKCNNFSRERSSDDCWIESYNSLSNTLGDDLFDLALSIRRRAFAYFDSDARDKSSSFMERSPEETDRVDRGFFLLANFLAFLDSEPWEKPPMESDDPVLSILDIVLTWLGGVLVMLDTDPCGMSAMDRASSEEFDLDLILERLLDDVASSSFDRQRAFPLIPGMKKGEAVSVGPGSSGSESERISRVSGLDGNIGVPGVSEFRWWGYEAALSTTIFSPS
jgi:hypothetical protein